MNTYRNRFTSDNIETKKKTYINGTTASSLPSTPPPLEAKKKEEWSKLILKDSAK
jgi:hypothetical protein